MVSMDVTELGCMLGAKCEGKLSEEEKKIIHTENSKYI
jgi:hypothetical protein